MFIMNKKGFIFLDVGNVEDPKKIATRILDRYLEKGMDYCCTVVGKYTIVVEKFINDLPEIDELLAKIRQDDKINPLIRKATTFIGVEQT
jgi:hypothetical protein